LCKISPAESKTRQKAEVSDMLAVVLTLLSVALSASTLNLKPLECQVVTDPNQKFHVAPSPTTPGSRELV
jgi:hypothetical protein